MFDHLQVTVEGPKLDIYSQEYWCQFHGTSEENVFRAYITVMWMDELSCLMWLDSFGNSGSMEMALEETHEAGAPKLDRLRFEGQLLLKGWLFDLAYLLTDDSSD